MTKKEYIIKALDAIQEYFPLARGLKIILDSEAIDETTIDSIIAIIQKTIDEIEDNEAKMKLKKSQQFLEKLKTIEKESYIKDQESISMFDDMIKHI